MATTSKKTEVKHTYLIEKDDLKTPVESPLETDFNNYIQFPFQNKVTCLAFAIKDGIIVYF